MTDRKNVDFVQKSNKPHWFSKMRKPFSVLPILGSRITSVASVLKNFPLWLPGKLSVTNLSFAVTLIGLMVSMFKVWIAFGYFRKFYWFPWDSSCFGSLLQFCHYFWMYCSKRVLSATLSKLFNRIYDLYYILVK